MGVASLVAMVTSLPPDGDFATILGDGGTIPVGFQGNMGVATLSKHTIGFLAPERKLGSLLTPPAVCV